MSTATTIGKKISATIGVFIALVHDGRVMLMRRMRDDSVIPNASFYGNWELPGGAVEYGCERDGFGALVTAALRKFEEKTGFNLVTAGYHLSPTYPMQTMLAKLPNGFDLAQVLSVEVEEDVFEALQGDSFIWVGVDALNEMALNFKGPDKQEGTSGVGIVSGYGKRMHVMALCGLATAANDTGASETLSEIRGF